MAKYDLLATVDNIPISVITLTKQCMEVLKSLGIEVPEYQHHIVFYEKLKTLAVNKPKTKETKEMTKLVIKCNNKEITIIGCPEIPRADTIRITVDRVNRKYDAQIVYMNGVHKDLRLSRALTDELAHEIVNFVWGRTEYVPDIKKLLGFAPLYKTVDGVKVYVSEDEFNALKKPVVKEELFGVQIPKAFIDRMDRLAALKCSPFTGEDIYTTIRKNIKYIIRDGFTGDDVIRSALEKLNVPSTSEEFSVSDMAVYYATGFLSVFTGDPVFINGDALLMDTLDSRMAAGNLEPEIYKFNMPRDLDKYTDFGLEFWEKTPQYEEIESMISEFAGKSLAHKRAVDAFLDGE